jgi:starch-binding outer membrane protein, SusD/RagB family
MMGFSLFQYSRIGFIILPLTGVLWGCDSLVDVDPPGTRPSPELIFQDDLTAVSAVRGMYSEMASKPYFNNAGISLLSSLSADDMQGAPVKVPTDRASFETNSIASSNPLVKEYCWQPGYRYIYLTNSILEGLAASKGVTAAMKNQLRAEALFIRAFSNFYLTNLFGAIPLPNTTELTKNLHIGRSSSADAYASILTDLLEAKELFSADKDLTFTKDEYPRSRANYWATVAFLARVYLYQEKWQEAELQATAVIDMEALFTLNDLENVFLANSREVIWQLRVVLDNSGPHDVQLFLPRENEKPAVYFTESLIKSLELNDARSTHWIDTVVLRDTIYWFANKYRYPQSKEQFHVELRLAELYLIRAEARAHQENLSGAIDDLDMLRRRANLTLLRDQSITRDILPQKIAQERRVELLAEGGHRWLDLKRTNQASTTLSIIAYKKWEDTDMLYPVPQSEIVNNPNLGPQNQGY